jgi:hypothetical protein
MNVPNRKQLKLRRAKGQAMNVTRAILFAFFSERGCVPAGRDEPQHVAGPSAFEQSSVLRLVGETAALRFLRWLL